MADCRKCELNTNCPGFAECPKMEKFTVVAGKYDFDDEEPQGDGRNYKFIGEPKSNLTEAIEELKTVVDYPFCEIEFTASNGERFILQPTPDDRPVLIESVCTHCKAEIKKLGNGLWLNAKHDLAQYCWVDPVHGSKLHEPK